MNINEQGKWRMYGGINPTLQTLRYKEVNAPHARTLRASYQVLAGRFAVLYLASFYIAQLAAPTGVPLRSIEAVITDVLGVSHVVHLTSLSVNSSFLQAEGFLAQPLPLQAGEIVEIYTEDLGTGGTASYDAVANIMVLDFQMRFSTATTVRNDLLQLIADRSFNPEYTRNPVNIPLGFSGTFAPHGTVDRAIYITPANKISDVSGLYISIATQIQATTRVQATNTVILTLSGGGVVPIWQLILMTNTVGDILLLNPGGSFIMNEGDRLSMQTQDSSTGGNVYYHFGATVRELDT